MPGEASSSRTNLAGAITGRRKRRGNGSSTSSLAGDGNDESNGLRNSVEGKLDSIKSQVRRQSSSSFTGSRRRSSVDSGSSRRFSALLSRASRKKDKGGPESGISDSMPALNGNMQDMHQPGHNASIKSRSDESLGLAKSVASSLLTDDEDTEA